MINFIYFESTAIRTFAHGGTPWFALLDLCDALGIDDIAFAAKLMADYERMAATLPSAGGQQEMVVAVSLSGFCTIASQRPRQSAAQSLKRVVMTKVVPTMRAVEGAIVLPPQVPDHLTSTTELADLLGIAPHVLGRYARHLKTAQHGELRPALAMNSHRPVHQWWWNDEGRTAVLDALS